MDTETGMGRGWLQKRGEARLGAAREWVGGCVWGHSRRGLEPGLCCGCTGDQLIRLEGGGKMKGN